MAPRHNLIGLEPPLLIVPAAGVGRRVQYPESKEMLLDENNLPLIEWALSLAEERNWPVHVISRPEKKNLEAHLNSRKQTIDISLQQIRGSIEYSHSLLMSRGHWRAHNIVILPDTRWEPRSAVDQIAAALQAGHSSCYGTFEADNGAEWGVVSAGEGALEIAEKCAPPQRAQAWGLLGFHREVGDEILAAHLNSHLGRMPVKLAANCALVPLQWFQDLTRNGWPNPQLLRPLA